MAKVTSFHKYKYNIFFKNAAIPRMTFKTEDAETISNIPRHTFFVDLFPCKLGKMYPIIYDKNSNSVFVVRNSVEVALNIIALVLSCGFIVWGARLLMA